MKKKSKKNYSLIDCWSINHFLSGMIIAVILIKSSFVFAISIALFVMILWEFFEPYFLFKYVYKTEFLETFRNQVSDIVVGLLGFLLARWVF